ncbi:MAG: hypothetical protein RLZZ600_1112 [Actinomycetota bacterium]|jgi:hypothetical protein
MSWLDAFTSWVGDPNNISEIVPSIVIVLCTVALIITVSVSVRRASRRIERAINGESTRYAQPSPRRDRSERRDRTETTTGPLRTGNAPVQTAPAAAPAPSPAAEPAPAPAQTHVAAPGESLTPPPSAQAFARAFALDNDPLNQ